MAASPHNDADFYVPQKNRIAVSIALGLILFISALDSTIVAVALPKIGSIFNDYQLTSWVVTAYIVTYTAFLPIVSKLTDIIGRKPVLICSTIFFMAFSGACGGAKSLTQLIVFRALQGIGGSAIYSGVVVTISTMVPPESVAKYTSIIGSVFAISSVAGPLVGGVIIQHVHWGWIFFVNLPIGFVGAVLLQLFLKYPAAQRKINFGDIKRRIDWLGSFLLLASSLLLALSLQIGGTPSYPWVSATVLAPLAISVVLIPIFIWVETKQAEPILPLRLFRLTSAHATNDKQSPSMTVPQTPNFTLIVLFTACLGAALYSTTVFLPQRLQIVSSLSPIGAAVKMIPILLPTGLLSPFAGAAVMLSHSYRPLIWVSSALGAIGGGLLSAIDTAGGSGTSFPKMYGYEVIEGVGIGITITVSTIIIQFSVDRKDLATATGFQSFARTLGGLMGIAISTAIVNARVNTKLDAGSLLSPALSNASLRTAILQSPSSVIPSLDPATQLIVKQAYSAGYSLIFVIVGVWFALGTVATLGLKHVFPDLAKTNAADTGERGEIIELEKRPAEDEEESKVPPSKASSETQTIGLKLVFPESVMTNAADTGERGKIIELEKRPAEDEDESKASPSKASLETQTIGLKLVLPELVMSNAADTGEKGEIVESEKRPAEDEEESKAPPSKVPSETQTPGLKNVFPELAEANAADTGEKGEIVELEKRLSEDKEESKALPSRASSETQTLPALSGDKAFEVSVQKT